MAPFDTPPRDLCLLRLSALGDVTHMLPVIHTLRDAWPGTRLTWIIGRPEHQLVGGLSGVDFIVFDKRRGWRAYADLRRQLAGRGFDALLHMQVALRANIAAGLVRAPVRIGFDRDRARDGHGLVVNRRIAAQGRVHVLDGFFAFAEALGIRTRELRWDLPIAHADSEFAARHLPAARPALAINACTSARLNNWRNWSAARYAAVANHAAREHGLHIVLTGGPAAAEREMADAIRAATDTPVTDLVGQTTPGQLAAVLARARIAIAPDTGPVHIANAVGTPVIGLYATSNPERTGPYLWRDWCVNHYPQALLEEHGLGVDQARWGARIRNPRAMQRIQVEQVIDRLDRLLLAAPMG